MNDILKTFLSMSVSGSLLLLILLAVRPLYRTRVSKRWQYYIYLVVIARLLLPFAPQRSLVGAFFEQAQERFMNRLAEARAGGYGDVDAGADTDGEEAYVGVGAVTEAASREPGRSTSEGENGKGSGEGNREGWKRPEKIIARLWSNLWLLWLGTALILFIRKITVYQSFVKYIKAGSGEAEEIKLLEQLSEAGAELGLKRPVELYDNGLVSSPLLLGFFHPCIILPETDWSEADFGYIVRHELIHYKRGDMIYKWLVQTVLCLHWFNPLVYRMEREIGRACELACDEAVLEMLDGKGRRSYGDMLLRAMEKGGSYKDSLASLTLNESAELLKERLGAIMDFKKISKGAKGCSLLLALLFAAGAMEMGAYAGPGVSETALAEKKGEQDAAFRYTQEGYYEAPFLFEIGWNVNENAGDTFAGMELDLGDESSMTVFYTDEGAGLWEEKEAVDALALLLTRLKSESAGLEFPLIRPLVVSVQNMDGKDSLVLAKEHYRDGNIAGFAAVFVMLTQEQQSALLQKAYEDDRIAFFSAALDRVKESSGLIGSFAQRAYREDNISFFSVLADHMSREALEDWGSKAAADKKRSFQAMLFDKSGADEQKEALERELDAQRIEEYLSYGITREGEAFYYQGKMIRTLLDIRQDSSVVTLEQNPRGEADIRIERDKSGGIESVRYLTQAEVKELFGDGEETDPELSDEENGVFSDWKEEKNKGDLAEQAGVCRLKREELPESVTQAMQSCEVRTWYVICDGGEQYIYYNGFAWEYAYEPVRLEEEWQIRIERLRKKDSGYLLIRLSDEAPVAITCDGAEVVPKTVECEAGDN